MKNYYTDELNRLESNDKFSMKVKVFDSFGRSSICLDLNLESIPELMKFLNRELKRLKRKVK